MPDDDFVSTKVRTDERDQINFLAGRFNVFGYEIVRAWRLEFDRLSDDDKRAAVARALNLHPSATPAPAARPGVRRRKRIPV